MRRSVWSPVEGIILAPHSDIEMVRTKSTPVRFNGPHRFERSSVRNPAPPPPNSVSFAISERAMRAMARVMGEPYPEDVVHGIGYEPEQPPTQEYKPGK